VKKKLQGFRQNLRKYIPTLESLKKKIILFLLKKEKKQKKTWVFWEFWQDLMKNQNEWVNWKINILNWIFFKFKSTITKTTTIQKG
jgi:hypothetical protein